MTDETREQPGRAVRHVPLSVLELAPVSEGSGPGEALAAALDVVATVEAEGYERIWFAEHHTTPGVVSTSPAVLAAVAVERTHRIRVGSGAVLLAHTPPAVAVEQFATVARLHPGRVDLGLGRAGIPSGGAAPGSRDAGAGAPAPAAQPAAPAVPAPPAQDRWVEGLLVPPPPPFSLTDPGIRERFAARADVVGRRAEIGDYRDELAVALDLLGAGRPARTGERVVSGVAGGADVQVWALASSPGESARVAGELGLPLAANYHVSPSSVLETVAAYRDAFRPGVLPAPYVLVSVDVLAAATAERAEVLGRGFDAWVLAIRSESGSIPYPRPDAPERSWTTAERALVADRVRTRFVGTGEVVADGLEALVRATGADELLLTTIAHDVEARTESFRLVAQAWARRRALDVECDGDETAGGAQPDERAADRADALVP